MLMASKNDKIREWAGHLYINEGYTKSGISKYLEISEPTIIRWSKEDEWEEEKKRVNPFEREGKQEKSKARI